MRVAWLLVLAVVAGCGDKDGSDTEAEGGGDADGDGFLGDSDCDDSDPEVNPAAPEVCDGVDNDCDGTVDVDPIDGTTAWLDADGDGHGATDGEALVCDLSGYVETSDDCDDGDAAVSPSADEVCNGIDDDCDGLVDQDAVDGVPWYVDADGDGYGDDATVASFCEEPTGLVSSGGDCDDSDAAVNPGGT